MPARFYVEPIRSFLFGPGGEAFALWDREDTGYPVAYVQRRADADRLAAALNAHGGPA